MITEKESRELLYKPKRRADRALEVSVMAAAGLIIVVMALTWWIKH
jgi:predicted nucleic acid-binding Zn ribbon protein